MKEGQASICWKLLLALTALACVVVLVAVFYPNNVIVFGALGIASGVALLRSRRRLPDMIPFLVGAVLGPTMEMIIIRFGAWTYTHPSIAGVPAWLPLLWGLTAFFLVKISGLVQTLVGHTRRGAAHRVAFDDA